MRKSLKKTVEKPTGDLSFLRGDVTGLRGDVDDCDLTDSDRKKGVNVTDLVL